MLLGEDDEVHIGFEPVPFISNQPFLFLAQVCISGAGCIEATVDEPLTVDMYVYTTVCYHLYRRVCVCIGKCR